MTLPEDHSNYVNIEMVEKLALRYKGMNNRFCRPDRLFPIPPMGRLDRFSRCFTTRSHHIEKKNQSFCVACNHWLTES